MIIELSDGPCAGEKVNINNKRFGDAIIVQIYNKFEPFKYTPPITECMYVLNKDLKTAIFVE